MPTDLPTDPPTDRRDPHRRDPDLRDPDLRRFPTRVLDRGGLPPLAVPTGAVRRRHVVSDLDPHDVDVARARRDALACLADWAVTPRAVSGVRLVVSELMTHALRVERATRLDLEIVDQRDHVTVVVEFGRTAPVAVDGPDPAPDALAPGYLGLTVVARVAERWGRVAVPTGGRLWAEVAAPRVQAG